MKTDTPVITKLSDYSPPDFEIKNLDLNFNLEPKKTIVRSVLLVSRKNPAAKSMHLDGEDIVLLNIKINGESLNKSAYSLSESKLTLKNVPDEFSLQVTTEVNPAANTRLMGLYVSGGRFCTQCEAQGFRRITFFPDRPDVLTTYKVRIEADKTAYPTLLANGNCLESGELPNGRHYALWHDIFPKPCYLFALVAGKFDVLSDEFTTMSGRTIPLDIFVDSGNAPRAVYAMDALKRSMKWDEVAFGREYDLDRFMIVAVRDFNFGAMENKGLNIFNSSLLLADEASATDMNFELIESVVAHEYFHNWSGNRITCRDWFQLCLKEGFTVFRDQEFSASQRGAALQRIKDVKALRARQFAEDAGPLSHPVRPAHYLKIDNFYTATIYEKGAELVRMLKTMLGEKTFRKGSDIYFETYDGTAATVEDFIMSFEKASGTDLSQFMRWYEQAGTPNITVKTNYDQAKQSYEISLIQTTSPTPGQPSKLPQLMPIILGLLDKTGRSFGEKNVLFSTQTTAIKYENITEKPVLSILRKFSAPVTLSKENNIEDALIQLQYDPDLFNRWEAGQSVARDILCTLAKSIETGKPSTDTHTTHKFIQAVGGIITDNSIDNSFKALALTLPSEGEILQTLAVCNKQDKEQGSDPLAALQACRTLRRAISEKHEEKFSTLYQKLSTPIPFSSDAKGAGRRALRNLCLFTLSYGNKRHARTLAKNQFETASNMTEELAAMMVLIRLGGEDAQQALEQFYHKWKKNPLVIDKWFAANAQQGGLSGFRNIKGLINHPAYESQNPNRVRSLIGGFASANTENFHRYDGAGYTFLTNNILDMDKRNPQIAARLLGVFEIWNKLDNHRQNLIKQQLRHILANKPSENVLEIATKSLGD